MYQGKCPLTDNDKRLGSYIESSAVAGERYRAFLPPPLPPDPPLDMSKLYGLLEKATVAIGRLDGMSMVLPDPSLLIYMYVRKEAVLSSQIEGIQSTLSDLLKYENSMAPGTPIDDVKEVSCYVSALDHGLERLKNFPLSLRLLREVHGKLLSSNRGANKKPGEFRTSQNWIGGTRPGNAKFVPPPPERLMEFLDPFEKFLHDDKVPMPVLIKAALTHVQFETIHPFLDGNGRLGRMLITLILCNEGILIKPLLYLSLYFKANRHEYYNHLQAVRNTGDWEAWVEFFLTGVAETADLAHQTATKIVELFLNDNEHIKKSNSSGAAIVTIHDFLQRNPITNTANIKKQTGLSQPTVMRNLKSLENLGMVRETTGKERNKTFVYSTYLDILNQGTRHY